MAVSGSANYTKTGADVVNSALRKIGTLDLLNTATGAQMSNGIEALNDIIKSWEGEGIQSFWNSEWVTHTFGASSFTVGTDGNNYRCIRNHTSDSTNKPVTGADYTTYWVSSDTAGSAWVTATAYTSVGEFTPSLETIEIIYAFIRDSSDYDIEIVDWSEYYKILDKSNTGRPRLLVYDRKLTAPVVRLYPQPDESPSYVLHTLEQRSMDDIDNQTDTIDAFNRWYRALTYELSAELAREGGLPIERIIDFERKSERIIKKLKCTEKPEVSRRFIKPAF